MSGKRANRYWEDRAIEVLSEEDTMPSEKDMRETMREALSEGLLPFISVDWESGPSGLPGKWVVSVRIGDDKVAAQFVEALRNWGRVVGRDV